MRNTQPPVHRLNDGLISASIWQQQSEDGSTRYNVTFARAYLKDDEWQTAYSYSQTELLRLARLSEAAYDWIAGQRIKERNSQKGEAA